MRCGCAATNRCTNCPPWEWPKTSNLFLSKFRYLASSSTISSSFRSGRFGPRPDVQPAELRVLAVVEVWGQQDQAVPFGVGMADAFIGLGGALGAVDGDQHVGRYARVVPAGHVDQVASATEVTDGDLAGPQRGQVGSRVAGVLQEAGHLVPDAAVLVDAGCLANHVCHGRRQLVQRLAGPAADVGIRIGHQGSHESGSSLARADLAEGVSSVHPPFGLRPGLEGLNQRLDGVLGFQPAEQKGTGGTVAQPRAAVEDLVHDRQVIRRGDLDQRQHAFAVEPIARETPEIAADPLLAGPLQERCRLCVPRLPDQDLAGQVAGSQVVLAIEGCLGILEGTVGGTGEEAFGDLPLDEPRRRKTSSPNVETTRPVTLVPSIKRSVSPRAVREASSRKAGMRTAAMPLKVMRR